MIYQYVELFSGNVVNWNLHIEPMLLLNYQFNCGASLIWNFSIFVAYDGKKFPNRMSVFGFVDREMSVNCDRSITQKDLQHQHNEQKSMYLNRLPFLRSTPVFIENSASMAFRILYRTRNLFRSIITALNLFFSDDVLLENSKFLEICRRIMMQFCQIYTRDNRGVSRTWSQER